MNVPASRSQDALPGAASGEVRIGQPADKLLSDVIENYRTTKSYRDHGTVIGYKDDGVTEDYRFEFKTAFVRPARFRFEWSEPWPRAGWPRRVVWSNGGETWTWWERRRAKDEERRDADLDMAIAGATGISRASAHTIPAILMFGEISGRTLNDLAGTRVECEDVVNERAVWVITGVFADYIPMRVFVDKERLSVLRIEESEHSRYGKVDKVTIYHPELGAKVEDGELARGWNSR
jgi:hypothetical protein